MIWIGGSHQTLGFGLGIVNLMAVVISLALVVVGIPIGIAWSLGF